MVYIPNPTDSSRPVDSDPAESAQAEFRALKGYIQTILPTTPPSWNYFRRNKCINGDLRVNNKMFTNGVLNSAPDTINSVDFNGFTDGWYGYNSAAEALRFGVASFITQDDSFAQTYGFMSANFIYVTPNAGNPAVIPALRRELTTAIDMMDCYDLLWGTPFARPITISFVAWALIAGTYCIGVKNNAAGSIGRINTTDARSYVQTFHLPANQPTYISITVPGDTMLDSGSNEYYNWIRQPYTGFASIIISFDLGSGSNFETVTPGIWVTGNFHRIAGANKWVSAGVNSCQILGMQVEPGGAATPFESIPYSESFNKCQRYFWSTFRTTQIFVPHLIQNNAGLPGALYEVSQQAGSVYFKQQFPTQMSRDDITVTTYNPSANNSAARDITGAVDTGIPAVIAGTFNAKGFVLQAATAAVGRLCAVHATASADIMIN